MRIGLHSGEAVVGNIGTSILMNYTAIGDTVNTAKRIEEICEPDQILISSDTYALLKCEELDPRHVVMQPQGRKQLKGRSMRHRSLLRGRPHFVSPCHHNAGR